MVFSDSSTNLGIVQQARSFMRVDATQWPTAKIVNSCNNWLDFVIAEGIKSDRKFPFDDTNHEAIPEGTDDLTINVSDYAFLTDQQGNRILNLLWVSVLNGSIWTPLTPVDRNDQNYDAQTFGVTSGIPTQYDKISDNIIRLNRKPTATVADGIKYGFQRGPSYFTASDTTKEPGVASTLHRGFVIASAYDGALTLGLQNLNALQIEREREVQHAIGYFQIRDNDEPSRIIPVRESCR